MLGLGNAFSVPSPQQFLAPMSCVTITSYLNFAEPDPQPLDLSIPKPKARQHWSGGSIVEENSGANADTGSSHRRIANHVPSPSLPLSWSSPHVRIHLSQNFAPHAAPTRTSCWPQQPEQQPPCSVWFAESIGAKAHERIKNFIRSNAHGLDSEFVYRQLATTMLFLQNSGYYYSHLNWEESLKLLKDTEVGTFLVRDSSDSRYLFSLSMQTQRGPASVRIQYVNGTFRLDAEDSLRPVLPNFASVPEMIDFYVSQWKLCHQSGQVWIDSHGAMYSTIVLTKPLRNKCPSLQHLSRLAWNRTACDKKLQLGLHAAVLPISVQEYLKDYPFQH